MSRMMRMAQVALALLVVGSLVVAPGCSKKPKPVVEIAKEVPPPPPVEEPKKEVPPPPPEVVLADIFFDFDKYNLRDDARRTLESNARSLMGDPSVKATLEGHCDERGTVEYNLALGEKRAQSAKNFLVEFGIDAGRLTTISYGEERPFAQGHDESAWSQNRRVHFVKQ